MRFHKVLAVLALGVPLGLANAQKLPGGLNQQELTTYARLLAMTDTRQLQMPVVEKALSAKWRPLRAAAALAIGQLASPIGSPGAPRLRALLHDRDATVAANAAYALGLLRDSASIPALAETLGAVALGHGVTRESAWALGEIGAPARAAIVEALHTKRSDHDTMIQLLMAASKLRPVPVADIRPYLKEGHPSVVWAAAYAIARPHSAAGVRDLIELEASPALRERTVAPEMSVQIEAPYLDFATGNRRTRAEVARALWKPAAGDSLGDQAFAALTRIAADPDPHVRINAVRSLGTYGPRAESLLAAATKDSDPNVRIAAAQSLSGVLVVGSSNWIDLWAADTSLAYRSGLLASATRSRLRPAELATWARDDDWRRRAAVASSGGDTLDRAFALARAMPLTRDKDPRVRVNALSAIVPPSSVKMEDSVHAALVTALRDPDPFVRATAIGLLANKPSAADFPAVLESYRFSSKDADNDARLAGVQYFGMLLKKDSTSVTAAIRSELGALPVPKDPLERAAAKGIPGLAGWTGVAEAARPLGWYEGVLRAVLLPVYGGKPPHATIHTARGDLRLELFGADAPITVNNFLTLARSGYYRNTRFHRVVPNFVAQDGDPRGDGSGGPGYAIRDEFNRRRYERGALGMALSGADTGGSQYFLTHSPQPHLDGHYTVFGRLISGFDVLDRIVQGDVITSVDAR